MNSYSLAFERFQQLASAGGPTSILSTLEAAEAEPISVSEYNNRIANGVTDSERTVKALRGVEGKRLRFAD